MSDHRFPLPVSHSRAPLDVSRWAAAAWLFAAFMLGGACATALHCWFIFHAP